MNLHGIANAYVSAVNPNTLATLQSSTGYSTNADGSRTPSYAAAVTIMVQMQALQYNDITQLDGLNIEGERRALYINGNWDGVQRADGKGGDLITLSDNSVWLVALVLENWAMRDGWVKVAVTRQVS